MSRVLVVDDDAVTRRMVRHFLEQSGCRVEEASTAEEGLGSVQTSDPHVLILDWHLPGIEGIEALKQFSSARPSLPVVMLTMEKAVESAVEAMKAGAFEYLVKPVDPTALVVAVQAALTLSRERRKRQDLEDKLSRVAQISPFPEILTCAPAMKSLFRLMERVLDKDLTVLIQGESGTGKELVAKAIHSHGKRRKGPFVVLNCAALPENLVESELFGHEKGAFTGATAARTGHVELAETGTLFLDEVGELPPPIQPKFLRCLQDRRVQRVGGSQIKQVDFRLIAATNRDLMQDVVKGEFRDDLFYRLAVFPMQLPPLRERREDILLLVKHFLRLGNRERMWIEPQAAELLEAYPWPGNVRELENFVARVSVMLETDRLSAEVVSDQLGMMGVSPVPEIWTRSSYGQVDSYVQPVTQDVVPTGMSAPVSPVHPATPSRPSSVRSTPPPVIAPLTPGRRPSPNEVLPMEEVERRVITRALAAFRGNVTETARALGIGRATLYRYIRKYKLGEDSEED